MQKRIAWLATLGVVAASVVASGCTIRRRPPPRQAPPYGQQQPPGPNGQMAMPQWPFLAFSMPAPLPAPGIFRPVNVQALIGTMHKSPCAPREMSPGNWIGFDCTLGGLIGRAVPFQRTQQFTTSTGSLPPLVDHRASGLEGPVKNQGAVGTCTAVSLSSAMEHAYRKQRISENISALHIWSNYSTPEMSQAGDSNVDRRITAEATWPYDPAQACKMMRRSYDSCGSAYGVTPNTASADPQIQQSKAAADGSGRFGLVGVERVPSTDPNELAAILAGGDDLWVAFNINQEAWTTRNMERNVIQDYTATSSTGHAVVLAGYRTTDDGREFLIHNSWGTSWGEGGYAWISDRMVATQLRYAYRVRVGDNGGLTGGGECGAGQAKDAVYGQCVSACPNGTAPAAGLCLPGLPGAPGPSPGPAPGGQGGCPAGQAKDLLSGQCAAACGNGAPPVGGLCLPQVQPGG
jgi:hypothetical protein